MAFVPPYMGNVSNFADLANDPSLRVNDPEKYASVQDVVDITQMPV